MIADVDERRSRRQFAPESPAKQNEFVDVAEPLCRRRTKGADSSEHGRWSNELGLNATLAQAVQHHRIESLHALLLIERVVTDQQNHCFDRVGRLARAVGRHKRSAREQFFQQV